MMRAAPDALGGFDYLLGDDDFDAPDESTSVVDREAPLSVPTSPFLEGNEHILRRNDDAGGGESQSAITVQKGCAVLGTETQLAVAYQVIFMESGQAVVYLTVGEPGSMQKPRMTHMAMAVPPTNASPTVAPATTLFGGSNDNVDAATSLARRLAKLWKRHVVATIEVAGGGGSDVHMLVAAAERVLLEKVVLPQPQATDPVTS